MVDWLLVDGNAGGTLVFGSLVGNAFMKERQVITHPSS